MSVKKLYLELTDRCNLNCKMCYRKSWVKSFGDMEYNVFKKLVSELKSQDKLDEIVLGGIGEPTCVKYFKDALELLKDYKITLTTNATLIDGTLAEYIIKYVDVLVVSIDGDMVKYEEIRGTALNIVENNIAMLNKLKYKNNCAKPVINVQFVLSKQNKDDIFKVMDIARNLEANMFIVSNIIPQNEENKDAVLYTRYENKEIKDLFQQIVLYGLKIGLRLSLPNYELRTMRNCSFVDESAAFICSSGDVVPCYRFSHEYMEYVFGRKKQINKYTFGNIKKETLASIWSSEKYVKFRECISNNKYPSCLDCDLADGCDYVNDTEMDCFGVSPSCGDCLWSRRFAQCP